MLQIHQVKHLAKALEIGEAKLAEVADSPERYCEELVLLDPAKPDKPRDVLSVTGILRQLQRRLYQRILLPKLIPSEFSHGGVKGRHIKSNVAPHLSSTFVFTTDVASFYPTVSHNRVYRLFADTFECAPDVARICTRLCTYQHHLALGLITSPILADQVMKVVDARIGAACEKTGLAYTRFVDDITISGVFDLSPKASGLPKLVERILADHGFAANPSKNQFGRLSEGIPITKVTVRRGHIDVRRDYIAELERQIRDAASLSNDGEFDGPYYTEAQIRGRVQFVAWINPGRRRDLLRRFNSVNWESAKAEAKIRGLWAARKLLGKRPTSKGHTGLTIPASI